MLWQCSFWPHAYMLISSLAFTDGSSLNICKALMHYYSQAEMEPHDHGHYVCKDNCSIQVTISQVPL